MVFLPASGDSSLIPGIELRRGVARELIGELERPATVSEHYRPLHLSDNWEWFFTGALGVIAHLFDEVYVGMSENFTS
jgi:hypothetical protein